MRPTNIRKHFVNFLATQKAETKPDNQKLALMHLLHIRQNQSPVIVIRRLWIREPNAAVCNAAIHACMIRLGAYYDMGMQGILQNTFGSMPNIAKGTIHKIWTAEGSM